jgi:hypothetical protein
MMELYLHFSIRPHGAVLKHRNFTANYESVLGKLHPVYNAIRDLRKTLKTK